MTQIHETAIVDARAQLDGSVSVGPYSVIGPCVQVASGTRIGAHCVIEGYTRIGQDNRIFQFNSIGAIPQDKKYAGEPCELHIGDRNTIREFCTLNIGSPGDVGVTRIGNDNWIMAYVHIADWVIVGGLTGIHQFVKIGAHAMIGFSSAVTQDIPPFMMADGNPLAVRGFNVEGLRRRDFADERIAAVKQMYKLLYRSGKTLAQAQADLALMDAFLTQSTRGIAR